jgi:hypothetical protein
MVVRQALIGGILLNINNVILLGDKKKWIKKQKQYQS